MEIRRAYFMVPVTEMPRAVSFYRQVLGLVPSYESPELTEIPMGTASLALHLGQVEPQRLGLGFEVDDVDAVLVSAAAAGGSVVEPMGAVRAIIADPDGNYISVSLPRG